jgi:pyruvate dehydrogenase E1 component alpha subunit
LHHAPDEHDGLRRRRRLHQPNDSFVLRPLRTTPATPPLDASLTELGALADANAFHGDLELPAKPDKYVDALERMVLVRLAEEKIAAECTAGAIKCPAHLAIGQEAPAIGVAMHLRPTDRGFGAHRSHGHFLGATGDLHSLFAETLGKETGASRGMGGSMHLISVANGFYGSVPIVGATIPIAVGAGLAAKKDGKGDIAISYFGDGATEEGSFHESMNLAVVLGAPVLFVCENNMFSSHLHISLRQPKDSLVRYAAAHNVEYARVDGNDIVAVSNAAERAIARMRSSGGPFFLECVTYRWLGHVGPRDDEDVGVKRKDDLFLWKKRDPIARLFRSLVKAGAVNAGHLGEITARLRKRVDEAWTQAEQDPFPGPAALLDRTWTTRSRK